MVVNACNPSTQESEEDYVGRPMSQKDNQLINKQMNKTNVNKTSKPWEDIEHLTLRQLSRRRRWVRTEIFEDGGERDQGNSNLVTSIF
jgi:hypothetical protein